MYKRMRGEKMKGKVLELLRSRSNDISIEELSDFTATSISEELFISRNFSKIFVCKYNFN